MDLKVSTNVLAAASTEEEYELHRDALEWSLAEPIVISSSEDIQSRLNWQERIQPFRHQVENLIRFCRRLPVTLIADDVGLGKTISAGLILSELMSRRRVQKALVVCPKILVPQWIEELDSKFGISGFGGGGSSMKGCENRAEPVVATTYLSAIPLIQRMRPGVFDMLILDEAHAIRNLHGPSGPPKIAQVIYKALESRMFKYVLMLTATPIQNRLWDIYSLIDCLAVAKGHRNPFGTPDQFAYKYLADGKAKARVLNKQHQDEFRNTVSSYMFRTRRVDAALAFPDREVKTYEVEVGARERELQTLVGDSISKFNGLAQSSLLVAMMSSPHALDAQLRNMVSNNPSCESLRAQVSQIVQELAIPAKCKMLLQIIGGLRQQRTDWRVVIFTTRRETQLAIARVLESDGISFGLISGGQTQQNRNTIEQFRLPHPTINVIISTDAGAEGVNLQSANVLVNYDLPWNPMVVEQRIGRVQRIGSRFKRVWVANLVHADSAERHIVARLIEKLQVIAHTVGDIEAVLESSSSGDGDSFVKHIREMVVAALQGQDVAEQTRKAEQSIEEGKRIFEEQQQTIDRTLGELDAQADEVSMPKLTKVKPRREYKPFVLAALAAEGANVREEQPDLFTAKSDNFSEGRFTFRQDLWEQMSQPGVFMGRAPMLYQPGKPAFERLVQRWLDKSGTRLFDVRMDEATITRLASEWVANIPDSRFRECVVQQSIPQFFGQVTCRTRVANNVDSYEKLIEVESSEPADPNWKSSASDTLVTRPIDPSQLIEDLAQRIEKAVEADADIQKFDQYYSKRLEIEAAKSDGGKRSEQLMHDLGPIVTAEASAVSGFVTHAVDVLVRFEMESSESLEAVLRMKAGTVIDEPKLATCEQSDLQVPSICLAQCHESGKQVLPKFLMTSEVSGVRALPEYMTTCAESGRRILRSEAIKCSISGAIVAPDLVAKSTVSGSLALRSLIRQCEFTQVAALPSELCQSSISGKWLCKSHSVLLTPDRAIAHESEAVQCKFTGRWYRIGECIRSDASGLVFAPDEAAKSSISALQCHRSELVRCEETGAFVLPQELQQCKGTGLKVIPELLDSCPITHRKALKRCFETCQLSGTRALPLAMGNCAVSGKRVLITLLKKSDYSGRQACPEFVVTCQHSQANLLQDEVAECELTGKIVDSRLLAKCAVTGKRVLPSRMLKSAVSGITAIDELFRKCEESGVYLLPEESGRCELTGKTVDKRLLGNCSLTGKRALLTHLLRSAISGEYGCRDLMRRCEESQSWLLPDEATKCEITGKLVDARLLERCSISQRLCLRRLLASSEASGKLAQSTLMVRCDETGKLLLPTEVATCEFTGKQVDIRLLKRCAISSKVGRQSLMTQSELSQKWGQKKYATRMANNRVALSNEVSICNWTLAYYPNQRTFTCDLCRLQFYDKLKNAQNEFTYLREFLDGSRQTVRPFSDQKQLAALCGGFFQPCKELYIVSAKHERAHIIFGRKVSMALFSSWSAALAHGPPESLKIVGKVVSGKRGHGTWSIVESWSADELSQ